MSDELDPKQQKKFIEDQCFWDKKFGLGWIRKPDSHHRLQTRRQFLSHAMNASLSFAVLPSVLSLASRRVYSQDLCASKSPEIKELKILYISVAGGIPFSWDVVHGGPGGQFDFLSGDAYYRHGLFLGSSSYNNAGSSQANQSVRENIHRDLGLAFHPASGMYEGIVSRLPNLSVREKIDGAFFPCRSQSDTPNNAMASHLAMVHYGFSGSLAGSIGHYYHTEMRSLPAGIQGNLAVTSISQARALSGNARLQTIFAGTEDDPHRGRRAAEKTLQAIKTMSDSALQEFSHLDFNQQVATLVRCGILDSVSRPSKFDSDQIMPENPASDSHLASAFGFTDLASFNGLEKHLRETAIVARTLYEGFSGVAGVQKGNGDCHGPNPAILPSQELKKIGEMIGSAIRYFEIRNALRPETQQQSLLIVFNTDGSMAGSGRSYNFDANGFSTPLNGAAGDMDESAMGVLLYSPKIVKSNLPGGIGSNLFRSNPQVSPGNLPKRQLGHYGNNGNVVPNSSVFWDTPSLSAAFLAMNVLALYGEENRYTEVTAGRSIFNSEEQRVAHLLFNHLFGT
jgi:hypothetical protein